MGITTEKKRPSIAPLRKCLTGIEGFDAITGGGIPRSRTTIIVGGPGTGKTLFSLQWLINGATHRGEAGIYVTFEESERLIRQNAATFGWDLDKLEKKRLFYLDTRMSADLACSGDFDLEGMLASLEAKAKEINAQSIVF